VWEENDIAVSLFLDLPWRMLGGMDVFFLGLDYSGLDRLAAWSGIAIPDPDMPRIFRQLKHIEAVAKPILNER